MHTTLIEALSKPLAKNLFKIQDVQEDGLYHYLLQLSEEHDHQCKRATNRMWSKKTYRLSKVVSSRGNWVMYYLADGRREPSLRKS